MKRSQPWNVRVILFSLRLRSDADGNGTMARTSGLAEDLLPGLYRHGHDQLAARSCATIFHCLNSWPHPSHNRDCHAVPQRSVA